MIRGKRHLIKNVPHRSGLLGKVGVEIEVLPYKHKWEWRVHVTQGGHRSWLGYQGGLNSWRVPGPHQLRGRCKDQGEAWRRAREVTDAVRAQVALHQSVDMQRQKQRIPL